MSSYAVVTSTERSVTVVTQPKTTIVISDPAARGPIGPAGPGANDAYAQANAAYSQANAAYAAANSAGGNTDAYNQANAAYSAANTADTIAKNAYAAANNAGSNEVVLAAYGQANAAYGQANSAYGAANNAVLKAGDTMTGNLNVAATLTTQNIVPNLNVTYNLGTNDFRFKDIWLSNSTIYLGEANLTSVGDEVRISKLNVEVLSSASGINVTAQSGDAYGQANSARDQANTASNTANSAYAEANLKLNLTGGTINGSLNVSGNLAITGNTTYYNVTTYSVDDPLIYLAANNDTSDLVDIGFMGGKNTAGQYSHTGLVRDAGDGTWYLFDNLLDEGHENNVVDFANTTLATLRANINANSILLTGNSVATQANLTLAHNQANSARDQANTARGTANDAYGQANSAETIALNAYGQANTARNTANAAYAAANAAGGGATIAAPNIAILFANAAGAANGTNNFVFNVATNRMGVGTNTPNSNIAVVGNVWVTTGINAATLNVTTGNINSAVMNSMTSVTGTITTANITTGNVSGTLYVGSSITTGGANGDISNVNTVYASTFSSNGINVTAQAADAYAQANAAYDAANAASSGLPLANGTSNVNIATVNGNVTVSTNGAYTWNFVDNGSLTAPGNITTSGVISSDDGAGTQTLIDYDGITAVYGGNTIYTIVKGPSGGSIITEEGKDFAITANGAGPYEETWQFGSDGSLDLPGNVTNFGACSAINFVANSSGDGEGYSTIEIRPDSNATLDQYLIIDPTVPNHIHIRAGGAQDNSNAEIYLGGENSHFKVNNGENPSVSISANTFTWTFDPDDGFISFPDGSTQNTAYPGTSIVNVKQIFESTNSLANATGTVTHNCALGHIFVHATPSANFTANFTDVEIPSSNATAFTLIIDQGATAYVPTAVQVNSQAQTVSWQGGTQPAGNANKKDVVSFSIVNNNGTWITLGQLTSFG